MTLHPTLVRQIARSGADAATPPAAEAWAAVLEHVSRSYREADQERYLMERSLAISSREMRELHATLAASEAEQAALLRIATEVARGAAPEVVFDIVSSEAARLLGAEGGRVLRVLDDERCLIVGAWGTTGRLGRAGILDAVVPLAGGTASATAIRTGEPAYVAEYTATDDATTRSLARRSFRSGASAPIMIGRRVWGVVAVMTTRPNGFCDEVATRLAAFANLVSVAVSNADNLGGLTIQATTDSLTGFLNHRAFHERLAQEVERAASRRSPLSLALVDIDLFKTVNDTYGHQVGDRVLAEVARRIAATSRSGSSIGRIGGEEFGWILPGVDLAAAMAVAERARKAVRDSPFEGAITVSVSAGVAALRDGRTGPELLRSADNALYRAKAAGRDAVVAESADGDTESPTRDELARWESERRLGAIRVLARAVNERDATTLGHGERVADLAARLAGRLGWSEDDVARIREAGLVHDVGKLAIPAEVLTKRTPLDTADWQIIRTHPRIGADIVAGVMDADQVEWVRSHHEHWDGSGYPDGLAGAEISAGAAIIAVAEAWDAMTSGRSYQLARSSAEAVEEIRRGAGRQFSPAVVVALISLAQDEDGGSRRSARRATRAASR